MLLKRAKEPFLSTVHTLVQQLCFEKLVQGVYTTACLREEIAMDSKALKTFRRKMANPLNWRKANRVLIGFTKDELSNLEQAKSFIDKLAAQLDVALSPEERSAAAKWVVGQKIDPQNSRDRIRIWKKVK